MANRITKLTHQASDMTNAGASMDTDIRVQRLHARTALHKIDALRMKPVSSAKWADIFDLPSGQICIQIEHETLHGITPEMIRWWFENISATTNWTGEAFDGPEYPAYLLWHHRDHISVTPMTDGVQPNNGFVPGGQSRILEQFNDFNDFVDAKVLTETLDDREFTFRVVIAGFTLGRISHYYSLELGGCRFFTQTVIGLRIPVLGWLMNKMLLPFLYSKQTARNWVRHNIEETGQTEKILPPLYARRDVSS